MTNQNKFFLIVLGVMSLFTAIASWSQAKASDAYLAFPVGWPEVATEEDFCIHPSGTYRSLGHSNSRLSENFQRPIFERNFLGESNIASESNTFSVRKSPDGPRLIFVVENDFGNVLLEKDFGIEFQCENGWAVYVSFIKGGNGESSHISSESVTRIARAKDGSLIINTVIETVSSKWVFAKKTSISDIWYRYEKVTSVPQP